MCGTAVKHSVHAVSYVQQYSSRAACSPFHLKKFQVIEREQIFRILEQTPAALRQASAFMQIKQLLWNTLYNTSPKFLGA